LFCLYIWKSLHIRALAWGAIWMTIGILYVAYKTRGFKNPIEFSEIPPDA
jgi:hypothetical protein